MNPALSVASVPSGSLNDVQRIIPYNERYGGARRLHRHRGSRLFLIRSTVDAAANRVFELANAFA